MNNAARSGFTGLSRLPRLLPEPKREAVMADWVGAAGAQAAPEVQKVIMTKACGSNAVRSAPAMGTRDFDDDAERIGTTVVKTAQMSSGFREMAKVHLPTARDAVREEEVHVAATVAAARFAVDDVKQETDPRIAWIERRGGRARVNRCLSFVVWFCQQLVDSTDDSGMRVSGALALGNEPTQLGAALAIFLAH